MKPQTQPRQPLQMTPTGEGQVHGYRVKMRLTYALYGSVFFKWFILQKIHPPPLTCKMAAAAFLVERVTIVFVLNIYSFN